MTTATPPITHPITGKPIALREMAQAGIDWINNHAAQIAIAVAAGIALYLFFGLARRWATRLHNRPGDETSLTTILGKTFARTTHLFMALLAARTVASYANPPESVMTAIRFGFTVSAVFQGAIWAREFILGLIERRSGEQGLGEGLANAMGLICVLVSVALFAIALIVVLDNLGVNVTGLVAGLGIGGIAIGLAAQGIFSDLFAALSIIFDKPFQTGETIQYDQTVARVERIGLKSTRLRSLTGEAKIISNTNLLQKEISNFQHLERRRVSFPIGVVYQTDPDLVARIPAILQAAVDGNGGQFLRAGFIGFGPSSLDFECLFDIYEPEMEALAAIRHRIGLAILRAFRAEGISFAYPTQTTFTAAPDGQLVWPYARPTGQESA